MMRNDIRTKSDNKTKAKAPKAKGSGKRGGSGGGTTSKKGKITMFAGIGTATAIVAALLIAGAMGVFTPEAQSIVPPTTPTTPTVFSVVPRDGVSGNALNTSQVGWALYNATDPADAATLVMIDQSTDLDDLDDDVMDDATGTSLFLRLNSTQVHDDDIYDADLGSRVYLDVMILLSRTTRNTVYMYETPNLMGMVLVNSTNPGTVLPTATANVTINASLYVSNNASQVDSAYVAAMNVSLVTNTIRIVVTLNTSIATGNSPSSFVKINGISATWNSLAGDTLIFEIGNFFTAYGPYTYDIVFRNAAAHATAEIIGIDYYYGNTVLLSWVGA